MKHIAIFTSGGDAPGMNACIRAVVRTARNNDLQVTGIRRGYQGMIEGDFLNLRKSSVSNIIQKGGTILKSSRSQQFFDAEYQKLAFHNLKNKEIEGVVVIGGDGSFKGASIFSNKFDIPFIGIPGTIDNDLSGTDFTIGYDTALNTVVSAVDKIRDTASSHNRLFFVEVMGKDAGFIALRSGISVGAEAILVPETKTYINELIKKLESEWQRKKSSVIIIVAEGDQEGGAYALAKKVEERFNQYDTRVSVLGHMQRGGSPSAMDRVLASRLGNAAVNALLEGKKNEMVGLIHQKIVFTPFSKSVKHHRDINTELLDLAEILSR